MLSPDSARPGESLASTGSNAPAAELAVLLFGEELVSRLSALVSRPRTASAVGLTPVSWDSATWTASRVAAIAASSLVSSRRSVIWFCSTMPSTKTTAEDSASVLTTTRTCSERRHSSPK